jgi:hypothetical protein
LPAKADNGQDQTFDTVIQIRDNRVGDGNAIAIEGRRKLYMLRQARFQLQRA